MTEFQPHPAYQPYYGNPLFTQAPPPPPKKKSNKLALLVGATALGAALLGGTGGALIVGLDSPAPPATSSSTGTTGQQISNSTNDVSKIAAKVTPSVVQVNVQTAQGGQGIGSGVILSQDGKILTNAHVVNGATSVQIVTSDGKKYQASVVGSDTKADIAVVQARGASGLTPATLGDSSKLAVGQQVVAIGSPGGLQNTVTSGIISALNRQLSDIGKKQQQSPYDQTANGGSDSPSYTAIQTDASINQGNSGGALVDAGGNVIGINSALYNPSGSAGSIGIGFSIPINDAKKIVDQITAANN
ncbi:putative serine protease PepD [Amycolatopsis xylanica]|uniref:Putative serine protease PepD n=1 Tax=Amycolatopsis xylanica TaxID=589385 RepID=A0A1H3D0W3_9PSEU|nr:trypsin-like peptidase domain-containing protein [Amycolatopsis xylanica]SDX60037.1 putative serine protease PepD [Amycolatopsis xylanica]